MLPELVYIPAHPDPRRARDAIRFETRPDANGEQVGIAFGSREQLVAALGPAQPWVCLPLPQLEVLLTAVGVRRILVNPQVDPTALRWDAEDLAALAQMVQEESRG